jgi:hypothetical protein
VHGGLVIDWKTSERSAEHALPQLLTLAVLTMTDHVAAIELREDGTWRGHHAREVDPWDRDEHAAKLVEARAKIPTAQPTPGDHCAADYCPMRGICPAFTSIVDASAAELVPASALVSRRVTEPVTLPDHVGPTLAFLDAIDTWSKAKRRECTHLVDVLGGEVRISETQMFRRVLGSKSSIDGSQALALAEEMGAPTDRLAACMRTTTFTMHTRVGKHEFKKPRKGRKQLENKGDGDV